MEQMAQYEAIINQETVDLYNISLGRQDVPPQHDNEIMKRIMDFIASSPLGRASPKVCAGRANRTRDSGYTISAHDIMLRVPRQVANGKRVRLVHTVVCGLSP